MPHYAALLVAAKVTAKVHHYTVIDLGPRNPAPFGCARSWRPHAEPHCRIAIDALASVLSAVRRTFHASSSVLQSSIATPVLTGWAPHKCCKCVRLPGPMLRRLQSHAQHSPHILAGPATRRDPRKEV